MTNAENHTYPPAGFARSSHEIPGHSFEEVRSDEIRDATEQENLVGLIRDVMHDQKGQTKGKPRTKGRFAMPFKKPAASQPRTMPKTKVGTVAGGMIRKAMSYLGAVLWRMLKPVFAKVKSYRPTPKHICFAVLAVVVFIRPWLIPITILALFVLAVITWLSLGPDRVAEFIYGSWLRLKARNPQLAGAIRDRFQAGVKRVNKGLSWLPGKWAMHLRLPDFSQDEEQQVQLNKLPDPFDRLAAETRQQQAKE